jgi:hypothetical protein
MTYGIVETLPSVRVFVTESDEFGFCRIDLEFQCLRVFGLLLLFVSVSHPRCQSFFDLACAFSSHLLVHVLEAPGEQKKGDIQGEGTDHKTQTQAQ